MSDSGSSQFPTRPPIADLSAIVSAKAEIKGQILSITGPLSRLSSPVTISGTIEQIKQDGTVTVKTAQGDITYKSKDRVVPTQGQNVEISVPPGSPPKQILLRPAPAQEPAQPAKTTSDAAATTTADNANAAKGTPLPRTHAPLDQSTQIKLGESQIQKPPPPALPIKPDTNDARRLTEEALIRLTPLSPEQVRKIMQQIAQQTLQATLTRLTASALQATNLAPQQQQALPRSSVAVSARDIAFINNSGAILPLLDKPAAALSLPDTQDGKFFNAHELKNFLSRQPFSAIPSSAMMAQLRIAPVLTQGLDTNNLFSNLKNFSFIRLPASAAAQEGIPALLIKPQAALQTPQMGGPLPTNQLFDARVKSLMPASVILSTPAQSVTPSALPLSPATAQQTSMISQPVNAGQMIGQIIGFTPHHLPVINMGLTIADNPLLFTLNLSAENIYPGQHVSLLPLSGPMPRLAPSAPPGLFELMGGFKWPVFDELSLTPNLQLGTGNLQMLAQIMPSPAQPAKIPAAALLFIAAVRAGDLQSWLGEKNIESLRRTGKTKFVNRMMREFSGLNRLAAEPITPEWRAMALPFYNHGHVEKIHLYYRSDQQGRDDDQDQNRKGQGARFIMDLNLSAIGPVQLDGFARGKTLDLAVRSQQPFSTAMRHTMTGRYIHTLQVAGLEGSLVFQSQPEKWIKISPRQDILTTSA